MSNWRVAESLLELRSVVQQLRPDTVKEKRMYGTIGDAAHASRQSDHNPWVKDRDGTPVVRALDVPLSVGEGNRKLAERLRVLAKGNRLTGRKPHPAFGKRGYIISDHRIASHKTGWRWVRYSGTDPHTGHIHVSVATAQERYDSHHKWNIRRKDVR